METCQTTSNNMIINILYVIFFNTPIILILQIGTHMILSFEIAFYD